MTNKAGMLPGDEFSFAEWKAAQEQPRDTPVMLPAAVQLAYQQLLDACQRTNIPLVAIFGLHGGDHLFYDLLSKPQNVSHPLLLARSAVVEDQAHKMTLMAHSLQSMDFSKLMNP